MTQSNGEKAVVPGLAALEAAYRRDLELLRLPAPRWTLPLHKASSTGGDSSPVVDVAIIGAGMAGLALGTALKHLGVSIQLYDKAPAGLEGPWKTTAKMEVLRSPKWLTGPALGFASLTFQAWYTAQWGAAAWEALGFIPREMWMDYLIWYRRINDLPVQSGVVLQALQPSCDGVVRLQLRSTAEDGSGAAKVVTARHAVLAMGRDGLGGPLLPSWASQIPCSHRLHSGELWDGAAMHGKVVVVVGGGSSAMDSAATALENGATAVHLLIRRADLPRVNKSKATVHPGNAYGYHRCTEEWRWRLHHYVSDHIPPPHGSTLRVSRHPNAFFHMETSVQQASMRKDGRVRLDTTKGPIAADVVVFATGFGPDWSQRPELASIAEHAQLWRDVYAPPPGLENAVMGSMPYLGPLFEFIEKEKGKLPGLDRVHCFCYPATLSHGPISGDIPQITDGARQLSQGLAGHLFAEDVAAQLEKVRDYADPELDGSEWQPASFPLYVAEAVEDSASITATV